MSKQSYMAGFCKVAAANNVDPRALAAYIVKCAEDDKPGKAKEIWDKVLAYLKDLKNKSVETYNNMTPNQKALAGAAGGLLAGGGLGAAIGGKKGILPGSVIGALGGGAAANVDWKKVVEYLRSKFKKDKGEDPWSAKNVNKALDNITNPLNPDRFKWDPNAKGEEEPSWTKTKWVPTKPITKAGPLAELAGHYE